MESYKRLNPQRIKLLKMMKEAGEVEEDMDISRTGDNTMVSSNKIKSDC